MDKKEKIKQAVLELLRSDPEKEWELDEVYDHLIQKKVIRSRPDNDTLKILWLDLIGESVELTAKRNLKILA